MQGHSLIVSEPLAHGASLVVGLALFGVLRLVTVPADSALAFSGALAVLVNVVVGGKINLVVLDLLGGLVARPVSGFLAYKFISMLVT